MVALDGTAKYTVDISYSNITDNTATNGNAAVVFASATTG
jgi:hypothetical protein